MQFPVATAQGVSQLVLEFLKIGKSLTHVNQLFLQAAAHWRARLHTIPSELQKASDFSEFKSKTLHAAYESQRLNVALGILPEASWGSWRTRQQSIPLVETDGIGAQADPLGNCTDLHGFAPSVKLTLWSIVQSQALSFRPRGAGLFAGASGSATEKQFALARVLRKRSGAFELRLSFGKAAKLEKKVATNA